MFMTQIVFYLNFEIHEPRDRGVGLYSHIVKRYFILENLLYFNAFGKRSECMLMMSTNSSTQDVKFMARESGVRVLGRDILAI